MQLTPVRVPPATRRRLLPAARWAARIVLWTALAVFGALAGLRLAGPLDRSTALGEVRMHIEPSWSGQVDAYVPIADWGVRAHAFRAPFRVRIEPRGVDRQALLRAAAGDSDVLAAAERDARDAAGAALERAIVYSLLGVLAAGLMGALLRAALDRRHDPHKREVIAWGLAPIAIGIAVVGFSLLRATTTFDTNAFAQPTFYARGAELGQLLQVSEKVEETSSGYTSSVQRTLAGYAALLNAGSNLEVNTADDSPVVLFSDLHGNSLSLDALKRMFSDRPLFFAGDLGHAGSLPEARLLAPRLASSGKPVIAVSGNHDSTLMMRRLAREGVIVLTRTGRLDARGHTDGKPVQRIGGMTVAGIDDPLLYSGPQPESAERVFSFSELPDGDARYKQAQADVVAWFDGLPERPDAVMIHENGLAQHLAKTLSDRGDERPLLILTGHDHRQHIDLYGQIEVVDAGTGGAGGVFGLGTQSVGIATLQLPHGRPPARAVDLINVDPISGNAQADRVVPGSDAACEVERVFCHEGETVK